MPVSKLPCGLVVCCSAIMGSVCLWSNIGTKWCPQILEHIAGDICWLLISLVREMATDRLVEIRKQGALQEPEPWRKDRAVTVLKWAEGNGLIEGGIEVFEDIARSASWSGNCEVGCWLWGGFEGDKEVSSARISAWFHPNHLQGLLHHHLYFWTVSWFSRRPAYSSSRNASSKIVICLLVHICLTFTLSTNISSFLQIRLSGTATWSNVAGLMFSGNGRASLSKVDWF
jgi:hypothetical protein